MKTRQSISVVPLSQLVDHPGNIREDVGDVTELALSIREHGILQPLVATEDPDGTGRLLLLAGHRRAAAAKKVGLDKVPVMVRHDLGRHDDEHLVVMLVENCQRRDLGPIEKAEAYAALRNRGLTLAEIARRIGVSIGTVSHYLTLLDLPEDELEQLRRSNLTITDAIAMARHQRETARKDKGHGQIGRPKGRKTTPHFSDAHPLAQAVRARCDHRGVPKVGGVGCGPCWEHTIRTSTEEPASV